VISFGYTHSIAKRVDLLPPTLSRIRDAVRVPLFPGDPEKQRIARILNTLLLLSTAFALLGLALGVPFFFSVKIVAAAVLGFLLLICAIAWVLMRQDHLWAASLFLCFNILVTVVLTALVTGGIESKSLIVFSIPGVAAAALLGVRWGLVMTTLTFAALSVMGFLGWAGVPLEKIMPGIPLGTWFTNALTIWFLFILVRLSIVGWNNALWEAKKELDERRRTEGERDRMREQALLLRKMDSLERVSERVAQDVNDLLAVLKFRVDHLKDRGVVPGLREDLSDLERAFKETQNLTRGLQVFCKKKELLLERASLDELIAGQRDALDDLMGGKGRLEVRPGAMGVHVLVEKAGITGVLHQLVKNAQEAIQEGGRVTIRTGLHRLEKDEPLAKAGPYVSLSVQDDGRGMDAEARERVFEPFFSTKPDGKGCGMASVFGIVRQHGGYVEMDSEVGRGSEFRVYLPRLD